LRKPVSILTESQQLSAIFLNFRESGWRGLLAAKKRNIRNKEEWVLGFFVGKAVALASIGK
jgi:hypothetical protein